MHDGSITFSTALDNAQLEKDLAGLTKKIEKQERRVADLTVKRDRSKEKGIFDMKVLDAEKAKLQEIKDRLAEIRTVTKDKSYSPGAREEAKDQRVRVNGLQAEWNRTENAVDRYTTQLSEAEDMLSRQKTEAGGLVQQIEEANGAAAQMAGAVDRAGSYMDETIPKFV